MNTRPERLNQIGFRSCSHPLVEVTPIGIGRSLTHRYCLTCGACLHSKDWQGGFGTDHYVNYAMLERHGLVDAFDFWVRQRPESRMFGDL